MTTPTTTERQAFLIERRKGMGGSDVAAALGLDPKKTPYRLWREKTGLDKDDATNPSAARRGNFLEPAVLAKYRALMSPAQFDVQVTHHDGWRRGNQDARAIGPDGLRRCVEVKTVNRNVFRTSWGAPWSDEVPDRALCQGLWYANLDDATIVDFAVLVIPDDPDEVVGRSADEIVEVSEFHVFQAARNLPVERDLIDRAYVFWHDHVLANVPPAIGVDDLDLRWPVHAPGAHKPAGPILELLRAFAEKRVIANEAKKEVDALRDQILLYAQDSEWIGDHEPLLLCKAEARQAHQVAASQSRVLRFTKAWKQANPTTPNRQEP